MTLKDIHDVPKKKVALRPIFKMAAKMAAKNGQI